MKAMVRRAPGELVLDDVARPGPIASHVLVRVTHSGVCGTDLKIYNGAIPVSYPRIMGHEMVGEIVEAGDTHAFLPGERVIVDPELYCGACLPERHADRARYQRRICRICHRSPQPRVPPAGFHRQPDRAADPGADDLSARSTASEYLSRRISGRLRVGRDGPVARSAGKRA